VKVKSDATNLCQSRLLLACRPTQLHITHLLQEIKLTEQDATGVGALLHAMLPQLASLSLGGGCGPEASATILSELALAAGGVLPLHTLHIEYASLIAITPIVGSLQKLSLGDFYYDASLFEPLLAHAQQLQELEVLRLPPPGCAWVSPSLQKLSFVPKMGCDVLNLRDVLTGNLPALREVQVECMRLPSLPSTQDGAQDIAVLRDCLTASPVSYSIRGIEMGDIDEYEDASPLQPWLQPLADVFADHRHAACVEKLCLANCSVDAGNVGGLASIFPAMTGGAQASSTAVALTALRTEVPLACLACLACQQ